MEVHTKAPIQSMTCRTCADCNGCLLCCSASVLHTEARQKQLQHNNNITFRGRKPLDMISYTNTALDMYQSVPDDLGIRGFEETIARCPGYRCLRIVYASCAWRPVRRKATDQGGGWASGDSCRRLVICLHLVGGMATLYSCGFGPPQSRHNCTTAVPVIGNAAVDKLYLVTTTTVYNSSSGSSAI